MYIVKENNEAKINKVAELVGKESKKLAIIIEEILSSKKDKKLTVEIIEKAIAIMDRS